MLTTVLTVGSGALVGFVLGLLGAGGSILAVPLLLYVVGVTDPHVAIGTSAVAVAVSALINLVLHARDGHIRWPCAITYAASGSLGAAVGAAVGKSIDGRRLLLAFAVAMVGVGASLLMRKPGAGDNNVHITPRLAARLVPIGFVTGAASGFFGIGGGFLIVPGLIGATNMVMLHAVGSSLVAITAFGAATAASSAGAAFVLWGVAGEFIAGGLIGGLLGTKLCAVLAPRKALLTRIFAGFVFVTAAYIAWRSLAT
ncbi:MAG: sulfite exporter TauE/SafE family protein [Rhodospirillaceae bacterium]|nr:sulfite exporter TauE/SafE family protein [Rhodospirillaceae bacterium]